MTFEFYLIKIRLNRRGIVGNIVPNFDMNEYTKTTIVITIKCYLRLTSESMQGNFSLQFHLLPILEAKLHRANVQAIDFDQKLK